MVTELTMYEAQKKKLDGLCDEHDLVWAFKKDQYPIRLTITPLQGVDAQMSMLEDVENTGYRSPESSMTWIFEDGSLDTQVAGGTFTISKELRTKIENILLKMINFWEQYFFRFAMENGLLKQGIPEPDEDDELPEGAEPF